MTAVECSALHTETNENMSAERNAEQVASWIERWRAAVGRVVCWPSE